MLNPDLLAYLISAPRATCALKVLRYAEETGYPTNADQLPALLTAMHAYERRNRSISGEPSVSERMTEPSYATA